MTTPFPFTSGQTLTAAQMNAITTLPINDQTASYTLVVGDVGKRVIMNVASANTVTVNNSIFAAGDTIQIVNKGAGVSTVTAGAGVTINTSDSLAVAQYQSGTLVALSASSFLFFPTTETVSAGGLVYITGAAFTTTTSVSTAANTFSSTYRNYLVVLTITASAGNNTVNFRMRASGTDDSGSNYYYAAAGVNSTPTASNTGGSAQTSAYIVTTATEAAAATFTIYQPQLADQTFYSGTSHNYNGITTQVVGGSHSLATAYDAMTFICAGNITGTYRIYGYADS